VRIYNGAVIDASSDGGATLSVSDVYVGWQNRHYYYTYASAGSTSGTGGDIVIRGKGDSNPVIYNWGVQIQNGSITTSGVGKINITGEGGNGGLSADSGNDVSWNVGSVGVLLERSANLLTTDGDIYITGRAGTGYDRYGIASTESDKQIKTAGYLKMDGDSLLIRDGALTLDVGRDSDIKVPIVGCSVAGVGCDTYALTKRGVGVLNLWGDAEAWNNARPTNTRATAINGTFTDASNRVNLVVPGVDPDTLTPSDIGAKKLYAFVMPVGLALTLLRDSSATPLTIYYIRAVGGSSVYGDTPTFNPNYAFYTDPNAGNEITVTTSGSAYWSANVSSSTGVGNYPLTYVGGLSSSAAGVALMPGTSTWQVTPRPMVLGRLLDPNHASKTYGTSDQFLLVGPTSAMLNGDYFRLDDSDGHNTYGPLEMDRVSGEAPGTYAIYPRNADLISEVNSLNPNYLFSYANNLVFTINPRVIGLTGTYTKKWGQADPSINSITDNRFLFPPYSGINLPGLVRAAGERAGLYAIDAAGTTAAVKSANGNIEYVTFTGDAFVKIESMQGPFGNLISKVFPLSVPKFNPQLPNFKSFGQQINVSTTGVKIAVPKISLPKVKKFSFF
jgi:hypothetical protein